MFTSTFGKFTRGNDGPALAHLLEPKRFNDYSSLLFVPYIKGQNVRRDDLAWDVYLLECLK